MKILNGNNSLQSAVDHVMDISLCSDLVSRTSHSESLISRATGEEQGPSTGRSTPGSRPARRTDSNWNYGDVSWPQDIKI